MLSVWEYPNDTCLIDEGLLERGECPAHLCMGVACGA